jgi:hypothetical protein
MGWVDFGDYSSSVSGSTTVELETTGPVDGNVWVDAIVLFDKRYHDAPSNFPDQIETDSSEPGYLYLSGPPKYGQAHQIETVDSSTPLSVTGGQLDISTNTTSGQQALALSNDSGTTYEITGNNTDSIEGSFSSLSTTIRGRMTLTPYGDGVSETPSSGHYGQEITGYELYADLDDTPVVGNKSYNTSLLEVLQTLANYADAVFEVQYSEEDGFTLEWTYPGQRQTTEDAVVSSYNVTRSRRETTEKVKVKGSSVPVTGEKFTSEYGTSVFLENDNILELTETVYDSSTGTLYENGPDYRMNWSSGSIEVLSSGSMSDNTEYTIDYRWKPIATSSTASVSSPPRTKTFNISGLTSIRECEIAARRIKQTSQSPLWLVDVTIPREEAGFNLVNELSIGALPIDRFLRVNNIQESPSEIRMKLGSRKSLEDTARDIEFRLSGTADRV